MCQHSKEFYGEYRQNYRVYREQTPWNLAGITWDVQGNVRDFTQSIGSMVETHCIEMTTDDKYYERLLYDRGKRGTENRKYKGMGRLCDYDDAHSSRLL